MDGFASWNEYSEGPHSRSRTRGMRIKHKEQQKRHLPPKLTEQTRTLKQRVHDLREMPDYSIAGLHVNFPFPAYDCQLVYMERVVEALRQRQNALLESPTGTGKTLCLLCSALAWRESLRPTMIKSMHDPDDPDSPFKPRLPTIIYASRTHSQLQQVISELKSTSYRPKMVVLGSREQMCIHSDVKQLRGRVQNQACRALCKSRSCHHQNKVAGYLQANPQMGEEPFDIEDIVNIGRIQGPCPYYMSRELHNSADILFVPYNYLIDKENRNSLTGIQWQDSVLIFDEAHNLESICADAASFDLPASYLSSCIMEAKQCVELALVHRSRDNSSDTSVDPENFAILKALLLELEKRINDVPFTGESGFTKPGPHIYDFLADIKITQDTVAMLVDTIDHAMNLLEDDANLGSAKAHRRPGSGCRLQALRDAMRVIFRGKDKSHASCYRFHVHEPYVQEGDRGSRKGPKGRTLSWWCFNPGLAMEEFSQLGVRSIILTSGTLAPLDSFAVELKLPFNIRLENPHVIGADQIWAGVVSAGPSGRPLNSSYRTRDSLEYKLDLGNSIVNFSRIVPDGLLVFFPSYYVLNQCIEAWQAPNFGPPTMSTIWERICKHKQPVIEPRESALFNHAHEDFITKLNDVTSSGAIFFAVCRGKVSEGLDFADKAGRAVVITGIPYAMKTDPKVKLKREYLDEQSRLQTNKKRTTRALTGEEWYLQQASRAVNQAVGRVIRHKNDYGAIILCDERFAQGTMQTQMSLWLRPHIKCYTKFGDAAFTLTRFFREKSTKILVKEATFNQNDNGTSAKTSVEPYSHSPELQSQKIGSAFYSNNEGRRANGEAKDSSITNVGFLGQKFTQPSGLRTCVSSHSLKSVASVLADSRCNTTNKYDIIPANLATGSQATVPMNSLMKRKAEHHSSEVSVVEIAKQKNDSFLGKQEEMDKVNKNIINYSGNSTDITSKNRVNFLEEVKAYLSAAEYRNFLECMRGFKHEKIDIRTALECIANLFSAPERIFLLHKFGDFVPARHQELYAHYLMIKNSAVKELPDPKSPINKGHEACQKSLTLQGLPIRSRKKPRG